VTAEASSTHDPWQADRNDGLAFVASIGATAIVLGWIAGLPLAALRLPAGLLVALFAPGYLLLRASGPPRVTGALRFVLPVPLTLALAAVLGVVLDETSVGLRGSALGLLLCVCSLGFALIAFMRGTHPVTLSARDMRPSLVDVLRSPLRPSRHATSDVPVVADLALVASVLLALAGAGMAISRSIDLSPGRTGSVALTGRIQSATEPRDGMVRAVAEITVENDRPGSISGDLRIGIEPARRGTRELHQPVTLAPGATSRVALSLRAPCGSAVRATLSHPSGVRRMVRLRVRCGGSS
jgi:hypothetical protein